MNLPHHAARLSLPTLIGPLAEPTERRPAGHGLLVALIPGLPTLLGLLVAGWVGALIALVLATAAIATAHAFGPELILHSLQAKAPFGAEQGRIETITARAEALLGDGAGALSPEIRVSPRPQANALVIGRANDHPVVCLTRGVLDSLTDDELVAILVHCRLTAAGGGVPLHTTTVAMAAALTGLVRLARWGSWSVDGRSRRTGPLAALGWLGSWTLVPLASALVRLGRPDADDLTVDGETVAVLGDAAPLASTLEVLDIASRRMTLDVEPALTGLFFIDPLAGNPVEFKSWFRTHAPTADRIRRLTAPTTA